MPSQARISPNWKEEVNQRLAAHKNRKPVPVVEKEAVTPEHHSSNNRAQAAAARVAARFAKAPSYSESLESEARAAVRAAEAVSRAALQAQAAAESVLAELQAAKASEPEWQFDGADESVDERYPAIEQERAAAMQARPIADELEQPEWEHPVEHNQSNDIRWVPDAPTMHFEAAVSESGEWYEAARVAPEESVEIVEPDQPIHANLIEFPREIVATRKARPRRAEGPFAAQHEREVQLSIFEVEPEAISIDPVATEAMSYESTPTWMSPEWSGMELDEHPVSQLDHDSRSEYLEEPIPNIALKREIYQAPLSLRAMASVVDGSLVTAAFLAITLEIVSHSHNLPGVRLAELGAVAGLFGMSALYLALFFALGQGTPGMRYARIALSTFDGDLPSRRMRLQRLASLVLSVLPVGVGVLWSLFDEDHLSWHDRLSGTYLRTY